MPSFYTQEQKDFLFANYKGITTNKKKKMFNARFGTDKSRDKIRSFLTNHKLKNGVVCRFPKGHVPANKGKKGYGWATMICRWCTSNLKTKVINDYLKKYKDEGYTEYIGIAYDEPKRIRDKRYPLVEYEMTEADCLKYCYEKGFYWDGLYKLFNRVSCWCCPLKNLKELKILYTYYPELWKELKEMDKKSYNQFRADYSVEQLEEKFKKEDDK